MTESVDLDQGRKDEEHCLQLLKYLNLGSESNLALANFAEQRQSVLEVIYSDNMLPSNKFCMIVPEE